MSDYHIARDYRKLPQVHVPDMACLESLIQQSMFYMYIAMHLDSLPLVSLLPVSLRQELLWMLPIPDIIKLEKTSFVSGINMAEYWKLSTNLADEIGLWIPDKEAEQLLRERYPNEAAYLKAVFCAQVAECVMGLNYPFFSYPHNAHVPCMDEYTTHSLVTFFYAVQKFDWHDQGHQSTLK